MTALGFEKIMGHLVETIRNTEISYAIEILESTHKLIVDQVISGQDEIDISPSSWGQQIKRLEVALPYGEGLIGKDKEKFVEIINIIATVERTISALKWMKSKYPNATIRECHPSTSDDKDGNDIVIIEKYGNVLARCEVTDVVSSKAGQNGKEKKDLKTLGCENFVPADSISRYIATSSEFADTLSSKKRKWCDKHYRYIRHETVCGNRTVLLEVKPKA